MKTSEIFQACVPLIESWDQKFICHAVYKVLFGDNYHTEWVKQFQTDPEELHPLCSVVHSKIDYQDHVYDYLYLNGQPASNLDCKKFRLELLKSLVLEYQAKGD